MANLMPQKVLHPLARGLQGADIVPRIRASSDEVFALLSRLEQSPLAREILDLERMKALATRAMHEQSIELTTLCGSVLCRGLSAGVFVTSFSN